MKKTLIGVGLVLLLLVLSVWWSKNSQKSNPDIVAGNGLHWHPEIEIYVKGVKQEMPANLGVGLSSMSPVHTHEPNGVVHLEFQGLVRKSNITLDQFFKIWNKDINSFGTDMKMTVNGKENIEPQNYVMQDKDKIELRYE